VVPLLIGLQEFEAMGQYTRGPWRIGGIKDLKEGRGREIAADDARIGIVYGVTDPDVIANARLIAAAPELLEACKAAMRILALWGGNDCSEDSHLFEENRALFMMQNAFELAISKAEQ
jgi:hypothetical protein